MPGNLPANQGTPSVNGATPQANGAWLSPQSVSAGLPGSNTNGNATASTFDLSAPTPATTASSSHHDTSMDHGFPGGGLDIGNTFQYPFVPQDLWQMPMTLEWDWADMTGYGGVEDSMAAGGLGGTGVLNNIPTTSVLDPTNMPSGVHRIPR
jgi:hypothetical protein